MDYIFREIKKELDFSFSNRTKFIKIDKGLKIECQAGDITVYYSAQKDISRAALIIKTNGEHDDYTIEEISQFEDVCLLVDCSRNAVRNVETVKKLIRNIAMMGYNSLMLYTEDTYEVDNEPMFGYLRGGYTKAEMKELDEYGRELGIELIPCIQTLAHLNQLERYKYSHFKCFDCSDILLVGMERTYELIENMFKTLAYCYTTRRIHIGMDEAGMLGRGKYLDINGYVPPFNVLLSHLNNVCNIAEKYGFKPMIWGDMFYHLSEQDKRLNGKGEKSEKKDNLLSIIPKNLTLCYWEYHYVHESQYREKLNFFKSINNDMWFAGGTSESNRGVIPHLTYSYKAAKAAISQAKKCQVKHLLETVWGDNGAECSIFAVLPVIMQYAGTANGIEESRMKREFSTLTGYGFDEFTKIEYAQTFCGQYTEDYDNPAKYGLYNDLFLGYVDTVIIPEDKINFIKGRNAIADLRKGKYRYIFRTIYDLNEILLVKYDLGIRLRSAYKDNDRSALQECLKNINEIVLKLNKFIRSYREQWLIENKPNGLEIQEIRLGGLKERLLGCKERLKKYLEGKVSEIPELEEVLLPQAVVRTKGNGRCDLFSCEAISSVNSFDGFTEIDV